ncbi:MAG: hypothetical protein ABI895_36705 [Deltaproteobacteria bacterium]
MLYTAGGAPPDHNSKIAKWLQRWRRQVREELHEELRERVQRVLGQVSDT